MTPKYKFKHLYDTTYMVHLATGLLLGNIELGEHGYTEDFAFTHPDINNIGDAVGMLPEIRAQLGAWLVETAGDQGPKPIQPT